MADTYRACAEPHDSCCNTDFHSTMQRVGPSISFEPGKGLDGELTHVKLVHNTVPMSLKSLRGSDELIYGFNDRTKAAIQAHVAVRREPRQAGRIFKSSESTEQHQSIPSGCIVQNMDSINHLRKQRKLNRFGQTTNSLSKRLIPAICGLENRTGETVTDIGQCSFGQQNVRVYIEKNAFALSPVQSIFSIPCLSLHPSDLITSVLSLRAEPIHGHTNGQGNPCIDVVRNYAPVSSLWAKRYGHWKKGPASVAPMLASSPGNRKGLPSLSGRSV